MATRRRSRFSTLTNTVSDINQRLRYVEKRRSYSRLARQVVRRQNIQPKAVATDQLANLSVTTEILDDNSVTNAKISADAVTNVEILDGTILTTNIGPGEVQNANMGGGQVDNRVLANNAVESRHIKDGEVKEGDIGTDAVTTAKINNSAVTTDKINNEAVTTDKINNEAVTTDKINNEAVTEGKIARNAVTNLKIGTSEIDARTIVDTAIITRKIQDGAVTADKIRNFAVQNRHIAENEITRNRLAFNAVTNVRAGDGLTGGGEVREPQLRVDSSVSRTGHTHSQYATTGHTHSYASVNHTHSGSTTGQFGGDVDFHTHTISGLGNVSSRTLKKDIEEYSIDPEKVLRLSLKKFRYLNHARRYQKNLGNRDWNYGYIAEEVLDSGLEELLIYDDQGKPFGLNYGLVGVLSLELVRSLNEKVEKLEQRVTELEKGL